MITNISYCPICYEDLIEDSPCTLLGCGHTFCLSCVTNVIIHSLSANSPNHHPSCPLDKDLIESIQYFNKEKNEVTTKKTYDFLKDIFDDRYSSTKTLIFNKINEIFLFLREFKTFSKEFKGIKKFTKAMFREIHQNFESSIFNRLNEKLVKYNFDIEYVFIEYYVENYRYLTYFTSGTIRKKINFSIDTIVNNRLLIEQISFYRELLFFGIQNLETLKSTLKQGFDEDHCEFADIIGVRCQELCHNISQICSSLLEHQVLTKAILLQMSENGLFTQYYEKKIGKCILCSVRNSEGNSLVSLDHCEHSVCKSCLDAFLIDKTKCVFECEKVSKIARKDLKKDKESLIIYESLFKYEVNCQLLQYRRTYQGLQDIHSKIFYIISDIKLRICHNRCVQRALVLLFEKIKDFEQEMLAQRVSQMHQTLGVYKKLSSIGSMYPEIVKKYEDLSLYVDPSILSPLNLITMAVTSLKYDLYDNFEAIVKANQSSDEMLIAGNIFDEFLEANVEFAEEIMNCLLALKEVNDSVMRGPSKNLKLEMKNYYDMIQKFL